MLGFLTAIAAATLASGHDIGVQPGAAMHGELALPHVSADSLHATFTNADHRVHIVAATGSMNISVSGGGAPLLFAQRQQALHGFDTLATRIQDQSFVSITTAHGNSMVLNSQDASESSLKKLFHEDPEIVQRARDADAAARAAVDDVFEHHAQKLKAFVDGAFNLHKLEVSGKTHPHVLPVAMTAMHAARELDHEPVDDIIVKSSSARRALQNPGYGDGPIGGDATHWSNGDCKQLPEGGQCLGMCGRGCYDCWESVCGDCCWHRMCYDHDICNNYAFFTHIAHHGLAAVLSLRSCETPWTSCGH